MQCLNLHSILQHVTGQVVNLKYNGKMNHPQKQVIFSPNDTIRLSMLRARTCCYICRNIFICFKYISISRSFCRCHILSASTEVYQSSRSLADLSVIDSCSARAPGFHCRLDEHFDYIDQSKSMISPAEDPELPRRGITS